MTARLERAVVTLREERERLERAVVTLREERER